MEISRRTFIVGAAVAAYTTAKYPMLGADDEVIKLPPGTRAIYPEKDRELHIQFDENTPGIKIAARKGIVLPIGTAGDEPGFLSLERGAKHPIKLRKMERLDDSLIALTI